MTTVCADIVGDIAVLPRSQFDRILELARQREDIELQIQQEEIPTVGIMRLADKGGAFAWIADEEDLYTAEDLRVRYR